MAVVSQRIKVSAEADGGMVDVTDQVGKVVASSGVKDGIVLVFCPGATGVVSTIEYEPGLKKDVPLALERFAPKDIHYHHHETWGCDNGRSHVRATFIGPDLSVPLSEGGLVLGSWQQIVYINMDTKSRSRELIVQIIGE